MKDFSLPNTIRGFIAITYCLGITSLFTSRRRDHGGITVGLTSNFTQIILKKVHYGSYIKVKGNIILEQAIKAQTVSTLSLTSAIDRGGWSTPRTAHFTPRKEIRYRFYRRLGETQARFGRLQKVSPPP
jgi:spore coat protein U-like protein